MVERQRLLFISPHPDDETYFWAGAIAKSVLEGQDVHILVLSYGEKGRIAVTHQEKGVVGSRQIEPSEFGWFSEMRKDECLAASAALGVDPQNIEFAGLPDIGINQNAIPVITSSLSRIDPHLVVTFDETGTSSPSHGDHSWAGIATFATVSSLLSQQETDKNILPSFRRMLTYHLPRVENYLNAYASFELPDDVLTTVDVSRVFDRKLKAWEAYQSQMHLGRYFMEAGLIQLPQETYYERIRLVPSCAGTGDISYALDASPTSIEKGRFPEDRFPLHSTIPNYKETIFDRWQLAQSSL